MAYVRELEEIVNYLNDRIETNKETVGIKFVSWGEERLIPEYPAAIIVPGPVQREWHATHKWEVTMLTEIWIYHAKISDSHRTRTRDDLRLAQAVKDLIHSDLRMRDSSGNPQCVMAWINAEDPAFIRRARSNEGVVGTRMEYTTISQEMFK